MRTDSWGRPEELLRGRVREHGEISDRAEKTASEVHGKKRKPAVFGRRIGYGTDCRRGKGTGESTVYRLVTELYAEGTLRRFPKTEGRGWLYQYHGAGGCSGHLHLKCVSCGKLLHLNCGMSEELLEHIEEVHRFKVDNGATVLYGLCADCRKDCPHQPALPLIPASAVCRHAHGGEER